MVSVVQTIEITVTIQICHQSCDGCSDDSETGCDFCANGFHKKGDLCIENCLEGTYLEEESNTCLPCFSLCSSCSGPRYDECSSCVKTDHFQMPNSCKEPRFCSEGHFFDPSSEKC